MKVYIVLKHYDYEGYELLDVFQSLEDAQKLRDEMAEKDKGWVSVQYLVEEWEVKNQCN